jgi:Ser/Thr protein kinase RdoA (MazF antagonist)
VKQFSEMNEAEQKVWWLEQANIAWQQMIHKSAKVEWLAYTHHPVFLVTDTVSRYILHMFRHETYRWDKMYSVAMWLNLLANKASLSVSKPMMRSTTTPITAQGGHQELGIFWNAIIYQYLDGETRSPETISEVEIAKIGKFLAEMHKYSLKAIKNQISFDFGLSRLHWDGLFSDSGHYPLSEASKALFSREQVTVMDTVAQIVKSAMDKLGQGESEFGLIHGDFLLKNILFHEGEVRALDFEYCGWGYYLYDLCPLLWQLKPLPNYKELEEALWKSYCYQNPNTRDHRPLLETFIAGRQVASMRWVAANQHNPAYQGKVENILRQRTAELQGFLETGILKRN